MGEKTTGRFGRFGGRYVAEALWQPLEEVSLAFDSAMVDAEFIATMEGWLDHRLGRPSPLDRMTHVADHCTSSLWFKREDLCHGGSFCGTSALLQAFLAQYMGRGRLITETASGDFGVALGSIGAALDMDVRVFMSREDILHEPLAVAQMRTLGVELESVDASSRGRKASSAEALRHWMAHTSTSFYCTSSLAAPDPYPRMLARALGLIGVEARMQIERRAFTPSFVIAPIGSGGFAAGFFSAFLGQSDIRLIGVQAGGEPQGGRHATSLITGRPGVFHGTLSHVLQDDEGQLLVPYSNASGLCDAGVGPQHSYWSSRGEVQYVSINDAEAREAQRVLAVTEGLTLSLESCHAVAYALKLVEQFEDEDIHVLVGVTGDGRRDLARRSLTQGDRR